MPERIRHWIADHHLSKAGMLFIAGLCFTSVAGGIFEPTFNNYLREAFQLTADQRGGLEFPRELPGFLVAAMSGLLFFLPEVRTAAIAVGAIALGMFGLAFSGTSYSTMILWMVVWSVGNHLLMPMCSSTIMRLSKKDKEATLLGQVGSITTGAAMVGSGIVYWLFRNHTMETYRTAFIIGGVAALMGAVIMLRIRSDKKGEPEPKRSRLVFKWRYRLFYILCLLFGARKQVFITFGPWVLVTVFDKGPSTFAILGVVGAAVSIFFRPWLGYLIDRAGERSVLMADGVALVLVCLGYGLAHHLWQESWAMAVVYGCYVMDSVLFAVGMARATYLKKIAQTREDITASLAMGTTIDHVVSMSIPALGGMVWVVWGFEYVFLGAAALALLTTLAASFISIPKPDEETQFAKAA